MGLLVVDNQFIGIAQTLVEQARHEICLTTFKLEISDKPRGRTLKRFFDTLVQKIKAGVKVRILFNWHDDRRSVAKTNLPASRFLKQSGAQVRYLKNNRCCHAKLLLIDRAKALLGSHNLSIKSCENNFELSYLIPDPETVRQLSDVFEHSFMDGKDI
jgi:phosphatidylserine/phosphatidylglycerophosphate/cardiolipin synthase-like enzyme